VRKLFKTQIYSPIGSSTASLLRVKLYTYISEPSDGEVRLTSPLSEDGCKDTY